MSDIQQLTGFLSAFVRTTLAERDHDERGATVAEYVILVAIVAAGAIAIGTLIITKFTGKAQSIPTE